MVKGTFLADALALMEIEHISFLSGAANPKMTARLAFVKVDTGATLGWTDQHSAWSTDTLEKLAALKESIEQDVARLYMKQDAMGAHPSQPLKSSTSAPKGIADFLNLEDVDQVPLIDPKAGY